MSGAATQRRHRGGKLSKALWSNTTAGSSNNGGDILRVAVYVCPGGKEACPNNGADGLPLCAQPYTGPMCSHCSAGYSLGCTLHFRGGGGGATIPLYVCVCAPYIFNTLRSTDPVFVELFVYHASPAPALYHVAPPDCAISQDTRARACPAHARCARRAPRVRFRVRPWSSAASCSYR